jgi:cytochrome c biogenesis protein CcmG/thiol:disulfide interchange protein DsbE
LSVPDAALDAGVSPDGSGDLHDADPPRRTILWVTLGLSILLIVFFAVLFTADSGDPPNPRVGEAAPVIRGTTIDGASFDLDEHLGQWVVVNFFATWCPPCVEEHPELIEFVERHRAAGDATVVSVSFQPRGQEVADFFAENGGDWPVVNDPGGQIAIDYAVLSVPETFIVTPAGFVAGQIDGGVTADGLDNLIAAIEAGVG